MNSQKPRSEIATSAAAISDYRSEMAETGIGTDGQTTKKVGPGYREVKSAGEEKTPDELVQKGEERARLVRWQPSVCDFRDRATE
jgi:hypothetical protein